jgi:hypothetical protein
MRPAVLSDWKHLEDRPMSRILYALASILLTLPALTLASTGDWPAISVREVSPGQTEVQTAVVEVPREQEGALLSVLEQRADSLIVVHPDSGKPVVQSSADGRVVDYPLREQIQLGSLKTSANPITLDQAKRAGTWVTIGGIGILSTMLYVTSDVAPATAGSITAAFLTAVGVRYYPQYLKYITASGNAAKSTTERLFSNNPALLRASSTFGSLNGAFIYNFITNGMFKLSFTLGDVGASLGSAHALAELATASAFNVLSTSTWDIASSRVVEKAAEQSVEARDRAEVVVRMNSYFGRLFIMAVNPLIFVPATKEVGMTLAAAYGAVGIAAIVKNEKFHELATKLVEKIETARDAAGPLTRRLNQMQSAMYGVVGNPFKPFSRSPRQCRDLFSAQ